MIGAEQLATIIFDYSAMLNKFNRYERRALSRRTRHSRICDSHCAAAENPSRTTRRYPRMPSPFPSSLDVSLEDKITMIGINAETPIYLAERTQV